MINVIKSNYQGLLGTNNFNADDVNSTNIYNTNDVSSNIIRTNQIYLNGTL